jgi:hypothetical protein
MTTKTGRRDDRTMSLTREIQNDIRAAKKIRLPWWGLLSLGIGSFLTAWLFDHLGRLGLALPTVIVVLVLLFAVVIKRPLKGQMWFWVTMVFIAALHVAVVVYVPWTSRRVPAPVVAGIASVDLCLILVV